MHVYASDSSLMPAGLTVLRLLSGFLSNCWNFNSMRRACARAHRLIHKLSYVAKCKIFQLLFHQLSASARGFSNYFLWWLVFQVYFLFSSLSLRSVQFSNFLRLSFPVAVVQILLITSSCARLQYIFLHRCVTRALYSLTKCVEDLQLRRPTWT